MKILSKEFIRALAILFTVTVWIAIFAILILLTSCGTRNQEDNLYLTLCKVEQRPC